MKAHLFETEADRGVFQTAPQIREQWALLRDARPDLVKWYADVPLSSMLRGRGTEIYPARRDTNIVDMITHRYGLGVPVQQLDDLRRPIGLRKALAAEVIDAGILCLSQDSRVPSLFPQSDELRSRSRSLRQAALMHHQLSGLIETPGALTPLETAVVQSYLSGHPTPGVATEVTAVLQLPHPLNENTVKDIIEAATAKVAHGKPGVKAQRAVVAREKLAAGEVGSYQNVKAAVTEELLHDLTDSEADKSQVADSFGISAHYCQGLIIEAVRDIEVSGQRRELAELFAGISPKRGDVRSSYPVGAVPYLYDIYVDFRKDLGEKQNPDGTLTAGILSPREMRYLTLIAGGSTGLQVADAMDMNPTYASGMVKMLLHENHNFTLASKREERLSVVQKASAEYGVGRLDIESALLTPSGVPFESIVDAVTGTVTLREAVDRINLGNSGEKLSWAQLQRLMSRLEAYYHRSTSNGHN